MFTLTVFIGGNVDYKTKQTICIKSHLSDTSHVEEFEGAVLLLRNPYSAIVAEIFRRLMIEKKIAHDEAIKQFQSAGNAPPKEFFSNLFSIQNYTIKIIL